MKPWYAGESEQDARLPYTTPGVHGRALHMSQTQQESDTVIVVSTDFGRFYISRIVPAQQRHRHFADVDILPQKKAPTVNTERLVGNAELFPYRDKYPRVKLWCSVCTSCDLPDLVAGCPYKTLLVLWMVSPNPPPSSILLPKSTLDSSVLMTITLEPLVRRLTIHGKETISNARPLPQTTHSDQRLNPSPAKSTDLLRRFIEAFKEVESYRYARRDWSCSGHVLNNLQKWKFDPR